MKTLKNGKTTDIMGVQAEVLKAAMKSAAVAAKYNIISEEYSVNAREQPLLARVRGARDK